MRKNSTYEPNIFPPCLSSNAWKILQTKYIKEEKRSRSHQTLCRSLLRRKILRHVDTAPTLRLRHKKKKGWSSTQASPFKWVLDELRPSASAVPYIPPWCWQTENFANGTQVGCGKRDFKFKVITRHVIVLATTRPATSKKTFDIALIERARLTLILFISSYLVLIYISFCSHFSYPTIIHIQESHEKRMNAAKDVQKIKEISGLKLPNDVTC